MDEFYVGYLPKAPRAIAQHIRATIASMLVAACALAAIIVGAQAPFAASSFEYDRERSFTGAVHSSSPPLVALDDGSSAVLVAPGKHGYVLARSLQPGTAVAFRGKLIERAEMKVIEVASPIQVIATGPPATESHLVAVQVTGEVVDSKCFAGVMNPGSGKVHRGCAARCLHGGIPAALVSESGDVYYLLDPKGKPLTSEWISAHAGERVSVTGKAQSVGGTRIIRVETFSIDKA